MDLASLDKADHEAVVEAAEQEDVIIKRGNAVENAVKEALDDSADVEVDVWNPWPWTDVLETIAKYYELDLKRNPDTLNTFVRVFDTIDTDGGGSIDMNEMFMALEDAGMKITEEGISTLFGIIDEDGNGEGYDQFLR